MKLVCALGHNGIFRFAHPPEIVSISSPFQEAAVALGYNGLVISNKLLVPLLMAFLNHIPEQARFDFPLSLSAAQLSKYTPRSPFPPSLAEAPL